MLSAVRIAQARTGGRATRARVHSREAFVTVELPPAEDWDQPVHDWDGEDQARLRSGRPLPSGSPLTPPGWSPVRPMTTPPRPRSTRKSSGGLFRGDGQPPPAV